MQFPKSLHAEGWHTHMQQLLNSSDETLSPRAGRRFNGLAAVVAVAALAAGVGLNAADDPRPLDLQLSSAMHQAGNVLHDWQALLSRGLQVSLRAVADGNDADPAPASAATPQTFVPAARPAIDADDRDQPVQPEVLPQPAPQR